MIEAQVLNRVLETKNFNFISENDITSEYFPEYKSEFNFIRNHFEKYHVVPDKTTFINEFPDFELFEVREPEEFLLDRIREEHLYSKSLPLLQKAAEIYSTSANEAVEYIITQFQHMRPNYGTTGVDFVQSALDRYNDLQDRKNNRENWYFSSGFKELDKLTNGLQRGEELVILFARSGIGKSWIGSKLALSVWNQGANVGIISPEMTALNLSYRLDSLNGHFSNFYLSSGVGEEGHKTAQAYKEYLEELSKRKNKLLITTPKDFGRQVTVSKIRSWIKSQNLDCVFIDGLTYLSDERYRKGDNLTTSLTNLSEDLMSLSVEMKIPVIAVVQANRDAADKDNRDSAPELHHIRNSDGIAHNATKVYSLRNKEGVLEIKIVKQRNGVVGNSLLYNWNIDKGIFEYLPNPKSGIEEDTEVIEQLKEAADDEFDDLF